MFCVEQGILLHDLSDWYLTGYTGTFWGVHLIVSPSRCTYYNGCMPGV